METLRDSNFVSSPGEEMARGPYACAALPRAAHTRARAAQPAQHWRSAQQQLEQPLAVGSNPTALRGSRQGKTPSGHSSPNPNISSLFPFSARVRRRRRRPLAAAPPGSAGGPAAVPWPCHGRATRSCYSFFSPPPFRPQRTEARPCMATSGGWRRRCDAPRRCTRAAGAARGAVERHLGGALWDPHEHASGISVTSGGPSLLFRVEPVERRLAVASRCCAARLWPAVELR